MSTKEKQRHLISTPAEENIPCELELLKAQYQSNPGGILLVNKEMKMISFNKEFIAMWGIPPELQNSRDDEKNRQYILDKLENPQDFITKVNELYQNQQHCSTDEIRLKDQRTFLRHTYPIYDSQNTYLGRVWYFLDITQLKQAHHTLEKQQIILQTVLENVQTGIITFGSDGRITLMNQQARDLYDIRQDQPLPTSLKHVDHFTVQDTQADSRQPDLLTQVLYGQTFQNLEMEMHGPEARRTVLLSGQAIHDKEDNIQGGIISLHEITDLRFMQEKLLHIAYHDALTGLPNRRLFHDLLEQSLKQALRDNLLVGVLFLDIDNFKSVNDTLGHAEGDTLLRNVGQVLETTLRDSDILCRWGGDEFIIALPSCQDKTGIIGVAEKLRETVVKYIESHPLNYKVSISIGIAIAPLHAKEPDLLIRNADMAMYLAKKNGKNRCELFSASTL